MSKEVKNIRDSNFELLRILCIFGIISMHLVGQFSEIEISIDVFTGTFISTFFNFGVSIFMLLSGYYGIKYSFSKLFYVYFTVWFYSVCGYLISSLVLGDFVLNDLIKSCFPVFSVKYWYMSGYLIIFIFSPYIEEAIKNLNCREFRRLVVLMFMVFSFIPTILLRSVTSAL